MTGDGISFERTETQERQIPKQGAGEQLQRQKRGESAETGAERLKVKRQILANLHLKNAIAMLTY